MRQKKSYLKLQFRVKINIRNIEEDKGILKKKIKINYNYFSSSVLLSYLTLGVRLFWPPTVFDFSRLRLRCRMYNKMPIHKITAIIPLPIINLYGSFLALSSPRHFSRICNVSFRCSRMHPSGSRKHIIINQQLFG